MTTDLFTPINLGRMKLRNRIVMAPLTRGRASEGNVPQDLNVKYYEQRASAGLIITEATAISDMAYGYSAIPGIHTAAQIAGWKKVTNAVHDKGGKIVLQLWHAGRISHPSLLPNNALPIAPSAIRPIGEVFTYQGLQDFVAPRALATEELPGIVAEYTQAAINALEIGFDGVELHAANGYLLDQFLRDGTNKRTDHYGGDKINRARLLLEVVQNVVTVVGADRVGVRISPINPFNDISDSDPRALFNHIAKALSSFGLAYLHVLEGGMGGSPLPKFDLVELRRNFNGPYMANFGYDKSRGNVAIVSQNADCVAFGTLFIANPDLVERFAKDAPLNIADQSTLYGGSEEGYTDYPRL
jgi:N-ethylmaleimide reductase